VAYFGLRLPGFIVTKEDDERITRLNAIAGLLGRLTGEAHNLVNDLATKMAAGRAATRSTDPAGAKSRRIRPKQKAPGT
jgi:hypothetical protein